MRERLYGLTGLRGGQPEGGLTGYGGGTTQGQDGWHVGTHSGDLTGYQRGQGVIEGHAQGGQSSQGVRHRSEEGSEGHREAGETSKKQRRSAEAGDERGAVDAVAEAPWAEGAEVSMGAVRTLYHFSMQQV